MAAPGRAPVRIALTGFADRVELSVIDMGPACRSPFRASCSSRSSPRQQRYRSRLYLARSSARANRAVLEYVNDMPGAHFRILMREARSA